PGWSSSPPWPTRPWARSTCRWRCAVRSSWVDNMAQRRRHAAAVFVLVLLALFAAAGGLRAHGTGTPRVMNQPAGPYLLSAWTDPNPLRVDETHVVVGVTDPDTRAPVVSDVVVTVRMTSLDDPSQIREEVAGTDNVNRLLFAAEF